MADIPESTKLLPCPFCESPDVSMSFSATLQSSEPAHRFIECEDCAACGASVKIVDGDDDAAKAAATTAWNTRVTSPAGQEATRAAPPAMDREAVERAAKAMAEAAKVGPWDRMHEKAPRGWGEAACKSYWRDMANIALSTLSADAIRQGEGVVRDNSSDLAHIRGDLVATPASHASDGRKANV